MNIWFPFEDGIQWPISLLDGGKKVNDIKETAVTDFFLLITAVSYEFHVILIQINCRYVKYYTTTQASLSNVGTFAGDLLT